MVEYTLISSVGRCDIFNPAQPSTRSRYIFHSLTACSLEGWLLAGVIDKDGEESIPKALNGEDIGGCGDSVRAGVRTDSIFRSYAAVRMA